MILDEQIGIISDSIGYNVIYAPDYPEEDATTLEREFSKISQMLQEIIPHTKSEPKAEWLRISLREVGAAFESFKLGDGARGRRSLQSALDYLRNAVAGKSHAPDFIVGPDGKVSEA